MVPMPDGVKLATDVHLPAKGGPSWPVILERTPYPWAKRASGWTDRGIAYVEQSVRGRFGSEGVYRPFADEGWGCNQDGAATVEWILEQEWCNGRVGTYGGSATGITSALLAGVGQQLSCQIIQDAGSNFTDHLAYEGGVFRKSLVEGWLKLGVQSPEYADVWKAQPPSSPYWRDYDAEGRAAMITAPGLHVGGWWDIFARGTLQFFMERQYRGCEGARGNQKLVMRPTGHGPWGRQTLRFPENYDEFRVTPYRRRFAQFWLCDVDNGVADDPAVTYYTVGDDTDFSGPGWEWRTAEKWPPFPAVETPYYLYDDGTLSVEKPVSERSKLAFTYDPNDPAPTLGGQNLTIAYGPLDQRPVSDRPDVLEFVTQPLQVPLEATGHFKVRLYVSSDAPDTDFTAKLVDVYPAGDAREILMLDSIQRVKYRKGYEKPMPPLKSGEVVMVEIDLGHISWIFNTGHRIGLQVSSSNYPRFEKNPNNGDEFPEEDNLRVAQNSVHMSKTYPSALVVPVRPPQTE
jgi:predicted acyl esterase